MNPGRIHREQTVRVEEGGNGGIGLCILKVAKHVAMASSTLLIILSAIGDISERDVDHRVVPLTTSSEPASC